MNEQQKKRLYLLIAVLIILTLAFLYLRNNRRAEQRKAQLAAAKRAGTPTPTPSINPDLLEHSAEQYTLFYPPGYEQRDDPNAEVTFVNPTPNSVGGLNAISVLAPSKIIFKRDVLYSTDQCESLAYVGVPKELKPKLKQSRFINKKNMKGCLNIYTTGFKFEYIDYQVYKVPAKLPIETYRLVTGFPEDAEKSDEAKQLLGALYQFQIK